MINNLRIIEQSFTPFDKMDDEVAGILQNPVFADGIENFLAKQKLGDTFCINRHGVQTNCFVGIIKYKNMQIEILPKLLNNDVFEREQTLKNLIYMLNYTKQLKINSINMGLLSTSRAPFIEVLIQTYARTLFDALKYTVPKNYVRMTENITCIRGKLNLARHIRKNCANKTRFFCDFDEFSEDNLLNQMFLFVTSCLRTITTDSHTKKLLTFIINNYADITLRHISLVDVEKLRLGRNQKCFEVPFMLAKLFLGGMSVDLSKQSIDNVALVWDMNILFEEFVFEFIKKNQKKIGITDIKYQKGKRLLRKISDNRKYGNTYVDMFVKTPSVPCGIVLDTKYKLKSRFDTNDVYQVTTYCMIHKSKNAILLYPGTDQHDEIEGDFELNMDEETDTPTQITTATIDLSNDLAQESVQQSIINSLKMIFRTP